MVFVPRTDFNAVQLRVKRQKSVIESFSRFDAADANCFDPKDKAKLLAAIEREPLVLVCGKGIWKVVGQKPIYKRLRDEAVAEV